MAAIAARGAGYRADASGGNSDPPCVGTSWSGRAPGWSGTS